MAVPFLYRAHLGHDCTCWYPSTYQVMFILFQINQWDSMKFCSMVSYNQYGEFFSVDCFAFYLFIYLFISSFFAAFDLCIHLSFGLSRHHSDTMMFTSWYNGKEAISLVTSIPVMLSSLALQIRKIASYSPHVLRIMGTLMAFSKPIPVH